MNLFKEETKELLSKYVSPDWSEVLSDHIDIETFKGIRYKVDTARNTAVIYSEAKDIFKSLTYPFEKVKVVIVGQDPYYNGNADGLAFSCKQSLSPSLKLILNAILGNIYKETGSPPSPTTITNYINNKNNWNLEYLAEQGVLLYNPTLTVESGKPQSHKGLWNEFTKAVFSSLINRKDIVFMMWGKDAQESLLKSVTHTNEKQLYLTNEHPAAASYAQRTWECNHFTECNKWLRERNINEIEWLQR